MHVGVEETVAEHLGEENLHTALGEHFHVGTLVGKGRQIGDLDAVDTLHHQHFRSAPVPIDLRHVEQRRTFEVTLQLAGVGRLAQQIEFVVDGFFVVLDHVDRVQQARIGGEFFGSAGEDKQPRKILRDDRLQTRPDHFDHHFFAGFQLRGMYLRHGG
ncbi:hypothetical protein D3C72_1478790 [compost metagenome]